MKKGSNMAAWICSVLFILGGIGGLMEGSIAGILMLALGVFLLPPLWTMLDKKGITLKRWQKAAVVLVLFALTCISLPGVKTGPFKEASVGTETEDGAGKVKKAEGAAEKTQAQADIPKQGGSKKDSAEQSGKQQAEQPAAQKRNSQTEKAEPAETTKHANMRVHFIDVGQADCILIESDGHYMLVDAGNNEDADVIRSYLQEQGIEKLDYVIGTHPHEDHIGSLDTVLLEFEVGTLMMPDVITTTKTFEDVMLAIQEKELEITLPEVGAEYVLGNATFTMIAPNKDYGDELNNASIGIRLVNGKHSFLMCGDAEEVAEADMVKNGQELSADVYKVGHHGSGTSTTAPFLEAVSPKYAVISVGEGNTYGHPASGILNRLKDAGVSCYRTDEQGTIVAESDGETLQFNCEPSTSMNPGIMTEQDENKNDAEGGAAQVQASEAGEPKQNSAVQPELEETKDQEQAEQQQESVGTEVHITDTGKKYHSAGCQYLNESDSIVTLEQAKSMGLTPCSRCNPPL